MRSTALAALLAGLTACGPGDAGAPSPEVAALVSALVTPAEHRDGEALYNANCSRCHGPRALGNELGPALVHPVYRTRHHGDAAFALAVTAGVRAHHFRFGDMPAIPGVTPAMAGEITAWVRWLQGEAGID